MRLRYHFFVIAIFLLLLCGFGLNQAHGQDGLKSLQAKAEEKGLSISSNFIADVMANTHGGNETQTVFIENWDINLLGDLNRLLGWQGARARFSVLQNNGISASKFIGDIQTANNIEATRMIKIYEAWLQQNLWQNRVSLLAGAYDINFEFDYAESGLLFLNSSQGIGGAIAASGLKGPPTFPATAPTIRLKMMPNPSLYLQAAVSDGVPGVEHVNWAPQQGNGTFWITEIGLLSPVVSGGEVSDKFSSLSHIRRSRNANYKLKIALGGWLYTRNFVQQRSGLPVAPSKDDKGLYLLFDMRSFTWLWPNLNSFSWHAQVGIADNNVSRMHLYWGSGITYQTLPWDSSGVVGFSVSAVQNSEIYNLLYSGKHPNYEVALEWTYQTAVTPWLNFQPDVQLIINPGIRPGVKDALVLGLRTAFYL